MISSKRVQKLQGTQGFTLLELLIVIILIAILSAIAIPTYSAIIAKIKPLCRRESCNNRDPKDQKCDKDGRTIDMNLLPTGHNIELRYSGRCDAAWARSTVPAGATIYVEDFRGNKYGLYTIPVDRFSQHYGDMGPGHTLKACVKYPSGEVVCTGN